jgi:hypothetical protein
MTVGNKDSPEYMMSVLQPEYIMFVLQPSNRKLTTASLMGTAIKNE